MGDRANVVVQEKIGTKVSEVFLYTHWAGTELPAIVGKALRDGRNRWDDAQYLARIVFCRMIPKEDWEAETGYGISAVIGDNSYPLIVLDTDKAEVRLEDAGNRKTLYKASFEDVAKDGLEWP